MSDDAGDGDVKSVHLVITGRVQGVFYRKWTQQRAREHGVDGWVRNRADGAVEAVLSGPAAAVDALVASCRRGPIAAKVADVAVTAAEPVREPGFRVTD